MKSLYLEEKYNQHFCKMPEDNKICDIFIKNYCYV